MSVILDFRTLILQKASTTQGNDWGLIPNTDWYTAGIPFNQVLEVVSGLCMEGLTEAKVYDHDGNAIIFRPHTDDAEQWFAQSTDGSFRARLTAAGSEEIARSRKTIGFKNA